MQVSFPDLSPRVSSSSSAFSCPARLSIWSLYNLKYREALLLFHDFLRIGADVLLGSRLSFFVFFSAIFLLHLRSACSSWCPSLLFGLLRFLWDSSVSFLQLLLSSKNESNVPALFCSFQLLLVSVTSGFSLDRLFFWLLLSSRFLLSTISFVFFQGLHSCSSRYFRQPYPRLKWNYALYAFLLSWNGSLFESRPFTKRGWKWLVKFQMPASALVVHVLW